MDNKMKSETKCEKPQDANERMKYEIAAELGLLEKIDRDGWKSLTSRESGRIGGLIAKKRRMIRRSGSEENRVDE